MTGDAFGFVDPMLSPGMYLALHSAELLSENLDNLPAYSREMRKLIRAWMGLIQYFYDGRIFAMYQSGMAFERKFPGRITDGAPRFLQPQSRPAWRRARPPPRGSDTACWKSCRAPTRN